MTSNATSSDEAAAQRRKKLFGDCALIEIIHLHDCLRGAIKALEKDVMELSQQSSVISRNRFTTTTPNDINNNNNNGSIVDEEDGTQTIKQDSHLVETLEKRVSGRFKVIWSVFRAHSSAEDEFIWPALQSKTRGRVKYSPKYEPGASASSSTVSNRQQRQQQQPKQQAEDNVIEQSEYEEDHASEEIMFETIDALLAKLRKGIREQREVTAAGVTETAAGSDIVRDTALALAQHTQSLSKHLYQHLEKEETQCMPLVLKHLTRSEIHDLVGNIMGKRSSAIISNIMTMAVQNLTKHEREEMINYMKQAMEGTFFDRWLLMSGWMQSPKETQTNDSLEAPTSTSDPQNSDSKKRPAHVSEADNSATDDGKKRHLESCMPSPGQDVTRRPSLEGANITGQAELERLIRAVASNQSLTPVQKNTTIQGLRDSVWKSNQKQREKGMGQASHDFAPQASFLNSDIGSAAVSAAGIKLRRTTPPSVHLKRNEKGAMEFIWSSETPSAKCPSEVSVPLFSAAELAPTYHDGASGAVLGCPHYARACKLRHPVSGRLYTCRLCCEQDRDMPMKDKDEPLDRYAVTEVMCMKCTALQPAEDRCNNPNCESYHKPFAKYFCRICHLYDDRPRPIFHCPYCNTCRMGLGLGIDFRHCMRCNACVSLADDDHRCIPQKLQGSCPICHESMFSSTEPLRGLKCGHVMHLSCFTMYRRGTSYTCPLCQRSMEDMKDHFALLDAAVRMQPMPSAYLSTVSNIYCQDCGKTGQVQYHFVGQKCPHCGSYNTREMARVQNSQGLSATASSPP